MVTLLTGASHTGKTLLAQRLIERRPCFCLSLDHLKMGLIRSGYTSLTPEDDLALTDYLWPIARGDSQNRHRKRPGPDPGGLLHPLYLAAGLPPGVLGAPPLSLPGDDRGLSPGALFPGAGLREPRGAPAAGPFLHLGAGPGGKPLLLRGLPGPGAHPPPHPPQLAGRPAFLRVFRQLFAFLEKRKTQVLLEESPLPSFSPIMEVRGVKHPENPAISLFSNTTWIKSPQIPCFIEKNLL